MPQKKIKKVLPSTRAIQRICVDITSIQRDVESIRRMLKDVLQGQVIVYRKLELLDPKKFRWADKRVYKGLNSGT